MYVALLFASLLKCSGCPYESRQIIQHVIEQIHLLFILYHNIYSFIIHPKDLEMRAIEANT